MPSQCVAEPSYSQWLAQARIDLTFSSTPTRSAHSLTLAQALSWLGDGEKKTPSAESPGKTTKRDKKSFHIHFNLADFSHHSESNQGHSDFWCLYYSQMLCQLSYGEPRMWWLWPEWADLYTMRYVFASLALVCQWEKIWKHGSQTSSSATTVCSCGINLHSTCAFYVKRLGGVGPLRASTFLHIMTPACCILVQWFIYVPCI